MIEFRTSTPWRVAYWVVTIVQILLLSFALADGTTGAKISTSMFLVIFFVLALQSRSPIRMSREGIADERFMLRRGWAWGDVDTLRLRRGSLVRPDVIIRHGSGRSLPLNLAGLRVTRDGNRLERTEAVTALIALAKRGGADITDER